jgi:hypothetical protein
MMSQLGLRNCESDVGHVWSNRRKNKTFLPLKSGGSEAKLEINFTTPALLFSTISLLLLAYTNRFLALAKIIRDLYQDYQQERQQRVADQIHNLRCRVELIRDMQTMGVASLLMCIVCMIFLFIEWIMAANVAFALSLLLMTISLVYSIVEIRMSVGALNLHLADMTSDSTPGTNPLTLRKDRASIRTIGPSIATLFWICLVVAILMLWYRSTR